MLAASCLDHPFSGNSLFASALVILLKVDLIICFDSSSSPTRNIQRMGRTGRHRAGRVVYVLTAGKEADAYYRGQEELHKIHVSACNMHRTIYVTTLTKGQSHSYCQPLQAFGMYSINYGRQLSGGEDGHHLAVIPGAVYHRVYLPAQQQTLNLSTVCSGVQRCGSGIHMERIQKFRPPSPVTCNVYPSLP